MSVKQHNGIDFGSGEAKPSSTPETDAESWAHPTDFVEVVNATFPRSLERRLAAANRRVAAQRVLLERDSYCPCCGHNRDTSSVSNIDLGDGIKGCQMCDAQWAELEGGRDGE